MLNSYRIVSVLLLIFAPLVLATADAGAAEGVSEELDVVERKLELGAHRHLIRRIDAPGVTLASFTTDGCSGGLSAVWSELSERLPRFAEVHGALPPWEQCCVEHDRAYHRGVTPGSRAGFSFEARKSADLALERCVKRTADRRRPQLAAAYGLSESEVRLLYRAISALMYRAVRLGGVPCSGLPWRWGYGWPACDE